jgi:transcriptional regulator with XRE-family HTH domain
MHIQSFLEEILENNYSIEQVAEETGLSESTLRQIKSGKTREPHSVTATRIISLYFSIEQKVRKKHKN